MNPQFKDFVEQIRSISDIVDVIGADIKLAQSGNVFKALSPFHLEKTPSFVVWPNTQTWHDFSNGGGLGGDVFAYLQERHKIGFKEALCLLVKRAGLQLPKQNESWEGDFKTLAERREVERLLTIAANYYHSRLPTKIRGELYKTHYGFTDNTIDALKLGWADRHLFSHFEAIGITREDALKTGLFVITQGGVVEDFFQNRLVFPYWRGSQVVYFIARSTQYTGDEEWEKSKYKKLLTHSERHSYVSKTVGNDYFYNEDAARDADELLITEGVTDCISAYQSGIACISPVTTRFRKQDLPKLLQLTRNAKRIVVCNDTEVNGSGEAGARETAAALSAEKRNVYIACIDKPADKDKIDINEFVTTKGPDALRDIIYKAKLYPNYLLELIPSNATRDNIEEVLTPVLESLAHCSDFCTDVVLNSITAKFGIKRRPLNKLFKDALKKKRISDLAERKTNAVVPEINVVGKQLREIVESAGSAIAKGNQQRIQVASTGFFQRAKAPLFIRGTAFVRLERPTNGPPFLSGLFRKSSG